MPTLDSPFPPVIAIDGPAASGKSTVGEALAHRLGFLYFDTGAMYRAVTLAALTRKVRMDDAAALADLAWSVDIDITPPQVDDGRQYTVLLDGADVTWAIRQRQVDDHVSDVSAIPRVREAMVRQQRRVAEKGRVVMVGRDIGTEVYPEAQLKIYLDATPEQRALRRYNELVARGQPADYQQTLANVLLRDAIDSEREASPLRQAGDAVRIDSSNLSISEVVAQLLDLVCSRLGIEAAGG